jgi:hypothetical protein
MCENIIQRCCGKTFDIRKALHKPHVVGNNRAYLRLLQHDFRYPDCVRIADFLPRQIVASMVFLPMNQFRGKGVHVAFKQEV